MSDIIRVKLAANSLTWAESCTIFYLIYDPKSGAQSLSNHQQYEIPQLLGAYRPVRRLFHRRYKQLVTVTAHLLGLGARYHISDVMSLVNTFVNAFISHI